MHDIWGRSREGAWIEIHKVNAWLIKLSVAPVRERGLKSTQALREIQNELVAPVRERGLKFGYNNQSKAIQQGRSREGAWIEMR